MKLYLAPLIIISASAVIAAEDIQSTEKALDIISSFADRMCDDVPLAGGTTSIELNASAKADLADVIEKVSDLGIDAAGTYRGERYQNVLQRDLASALKSARDCRLQIWKDLKGRFQLNVGSRSSEVAKLRREIADIEYELDRESQAAAMLRAKWDRSIAEARNRQMMIDRLRLEQSRTDRSTPQGRAAYERLSQNIRAVRQSGSAEPYTEADGQRALELRLEIERKENLLRARKDELNDLEQH